MMPLNSSPAICWPQRVVYISHVSFKDVHCGLIFINVPFCHEYVEKGAIAPCTPVLHRVPSMGKPLTSLPLLAFLCVLKACICCRVCVLFHTFLSFALTLRRCLAATCTQNDVMGSLCQWQLHLTCFIFVQAIVRRKAVRENTSSAA